MAAEGVVCAEALLAAGHGRQNDGRAPRLALKLLGLSQVQSEVEDLVLMVTLEEVSSKFELLIESNEAHGADDHKKGWARSCLLYIFWQVEQRQVLLKPEQMDALVLGELGLLSVQLAALEALIVYATFDPKF